MMNPQHKTRLRKLGPTYLRYSAITVVATLTALLFTRCSDPAKTQDEKATEKWSEKLGYPEGKKVLLLHMDDIGMCPEANSAAQRYIENNHILSASVMMPCANAEAFLEWAKGSQTADIGLHLTLTSEWKTYRWPPVAEASAVPGLFDPDGKMWRTVPDVVRHASAQEVEKEIRAQIEKCLASGYTPTHIDTHMGTLYASPAYVEVFFKVAHEYNIPANAIDLSDSEVVDKFREQGYPINDAVIKLANEYRLPKLDDFSSVPRGSSYEEKRENFFKLVKSLNPGLTEIIFHPSVQTESLKTITNSWQQRVWEAELFADPVVHEFLEKEGVLQTNWKEIMQRFQERTKQSP